MDTKWVRYQVYNGILFATYQKNLSVNLEDARAMVAERLAYQDGKLYPIVIHMNGIKTSSKEARIFMAKEGITGITMGAFIVNSFIEKVIFNFFISAEKPPIPTKAFTNEEDAVNWINVQRKNLNP